MKRGDQPVYPVSKDVPGDKMCVGITIREELSARFGAQMAATLIEENQEITTDYIVSVSNDLADAFIKSWDES